MSLRKLGDIATYINGYAFKPSDWEDEGLPIIRIQNLTGNAYSENKYNGVIDDKYIVNTGDVLISWSASLGVYRWEKGKAVLNQHIFKVMFDKEQVDKDYYIYQVSRILSRSGTDAHGSTMHHLTRPIFNKLPYIQLDIGRQRDISVKLNKVQTVINVKQRQLIQLDSLIKSRFVEMFGDPVVNPYNWKQATLKDLSLEKLSYGSGSSARNYDGKTRYIRITDIDNSGKLNSEAVSPNNIEDKYILKDGDILFARSGATVGKTYRYKEEDGRCLYAGYLIRLIPRKEMVLPDYVFYYTKTGFYEKFIESNMKVVAQPNINAQQYGNLIICVPPLKIQQTFVLFVQQVDKLKFRY